jgi:hypothetical protein
MLVSCLAHCSTMKIEVVYSSETSSEFDLTTRNHIPEDRTHRFFSVLVRNAYFRRRKLPVVSHVTHIRCYWWIGGANRNQLICDLFNTILYAEPRCGESNIQRFVCIHFKDIQSDSHMHYVVGVQTVARLSYPVFALNPFFP